LRTISSLAVLQHVVEPIAGARHAAFGLAVDGDVALAAGGRGAPARLCLDQLRGSSSTVAHDMRRATHGGRHQAMVDDDEAQILALETGFHQHAVADFARRLDGASVDSTVSSPTATPLPCSPRAGLTTTLPCFFRNASSASGRRPPPSARALQAGLLHDAARDRLVVADRHGDGRGQFRQALAAMDERPP
jgi:hypothetical protein